MDNAAPARTGERDYGSTEVVGVLVLTLMLAITSWAARPSETLDTAMLQPLLETDLVDIEGLSLAIPDGRRAILINIWATWCGPCRVETPALVEFQRSYPDEVLIVGIAIDSALDGVLEFVDEYEINYPIVRATSSMTRVLPPVSGIPQSYLLDSTGRLVASFRGLLEREELDAHLKRLRGVR